MTEIDFFLTPHFTPKYNIKILTFLEKTKPDIEIEKPSQEEKSSDSIEVLNDPAGPGRRTATYLLRIWLTSHY